MLAQRDLLCNNIIVQAMKVTAPRRRAPRVYAGLQLAAAALHVRAIVTVAACRMQLHGRMNRKVANFVAHRLIHHHEIHHGM